METKICRSCGISKETRSYYKHPKAPDGLFAVCMSCHVLRDQKWKKEHPEAVREIQKKYQNKNRERLNINRRKKITENWNGYIHQRREWDSQRKLKRYDGIVQKLKDFQKYQCALCTKSFSDIDPIDIDHDHKTNLIRGLLCRKCNSGLHYFEDKEYTKKALSYIKNPPALNFPPTIY